MSYDFDVMLKPCDHLQQRERMRVSLDDFRTLISADQPDRRIRGVVAARQSVRLYIAGEEIPRTHPQYGWDVVVDENGIDEARTKVVFKQQMRMHNLVIELSYITTAPYCLKCNGFSKVNDYTVDGSGTFKHITEYDKLIQRVYKFLLTSRCKFYPTFTSQLKEFIGQKLGTGLTEDDVNFECITALENLKKIQLAQKGIQTLTPQEIMRDIESINSDRDEANPTVIHTKILISSYGVPRPKPLNLTIRTTN